MVYNMSMDIDISTIVKKLSFPKPSSHKGQNGRMLLIGGSTLFHAASLWSLTVASRIVDLVHYCSVPENNEIVKNAKEAFRNGIVISRNDVEDYIKEDDVILIGPGMVRTESALVTSDKLQVTSIEEINAIKDEGEQTYYLTNYLLKKYPEKQWVIDAGALQMLELEHIPKHAILTPHHQEFEGLKCKLQNANLKMIIQNSKIEEQVRGFAKQYGCIVLLKGPVDIASNGEETKEIAGGNEGMTKGGTGDVLAGLIAALACANNPWEATLAGSVINKKAGEELYKTVGPFFNATDLSDQIPKTMNKLKGN